MASFEQRRGLSAGAASINGEKVDVASMVVPVWDLTDLYRSPEDPALAKDLERCKTEAEAFRERYAGKLIQSDAEQIADAIEAFDVIQNTMCKLEAYSFLLYSENVSDPSRASFYQYVRERLDIINSYLVFMGLEVCAAEDVFWEERCAASERLARYKSWIEGERLMRKHLLSEAEERLLVETYSCGVGGWRRLFDETLARLEATIDDETYSLQQALHLTQSANPEKRRKAALAVSEALKSCEHLLVFITNVLAKDKEIEDGKRGFKTPLSARNISNRIEDKAVDALLHSVEQANPRIAWRYYALKAKALGVERLHYWDRNAPYIAGVEEQEVPWSKAKSIVLEAYYGFAEPVGKIAEMFFDKHWIHAALQKGKESGAYSHPCSSSDHPYILMNYQGSRRDVMTLAHELGHGVHQYMCRGHGQLLSNTPLTVAETASVFGEQLVFRALLADSKTREDRIRLLSSKIEDMLNTVVRQTAFCRFEEKLHLKRRENELSAADLADIWKQTQEAALGPSVIVDPECMGNWGYISHFIHTPFYVYAYAFGDCLVNSLYSSYRKGSEGFVDLYLDLLKAGGSKHYTELLKPFDLNPDDPDFWNGGLELISETIDMLEAEENAR